MSQVIIDNLDPEILQQLEALAKQHDRPLAEEAKAILTQAIIATAPPYPPEEEAIARGILSMEKQMRDHAQKMGQPIEPERPITEKDREQIRKTLEELKQLKQLGLSLGGLSIREAREEGRRY
ncbi:MAG: hypothetical protein MUF49_06220 [Oculatellaceae cyanobacterium Prado106]|nr:hypothetical protein [Oculatellaceae cyanobacterium Prado106]